MINADHVSFNNMLDPFKLWALPAFNVLQFNSNYYAVLVIDISPMDFIFF